MFHIDYIADYALVIRSECLRAVRIDLNGGRGNPDHLTFHHRAVNQNQAEIALGAADIGPAKADQKYRYKKVFDSNGF